MAPAPHPQPSPAQGDWQPKSNLTRAVRDVAILAVLLGAALGYYFHRTQVKRQTREINAKAKQLLIKDTPKAFAEAETKLKKVLELESSNPWALSWLGELYALRYVQGIADAKTQAQQWIEKADKEGAKLEERFAARALLSIHDGKPAEAESSMSEVLGQTNGRGAHLWDAMGLALRQEGKLEESRHAFKKAHDGEWRNPRFAADYADSFFEDGDYVNAINYFGKGIESNSEHARCLIGRARAYVAHGEHIKDASDAIEEVLARPADQLTPFLKGYALTAKAELRLFERKLPETLKLAGQAIAVQPNLAWAHKVKGLALAAEKNTAASAEEFNKAIQLDKYVAAFYTDAAFALADAGDAAKGEGFMAKYGLALPKDDKFHVVFGNFKRKLGQLDEALSHFEEAIKANPLSAVAHYGKGSLLLEKKNYQGSLDELNKAIEAQAVYPEAQMQLGQLAFVTKNYAEGCQSFAEALKQYRALQAPREKLNGILEDVHKQLVKGGQKQIAGLWMKEAKNLIR